MNTYENNTSIEEYFKENAIIWIDDDSMNTQTVKRVITLLELYAYNNFQTIRIYIASPGGSKAAGFAIKDKIEELKSKGIIIETIIVSASASAASILSSSGTKDHRYIYRSATLLIHSVSSTLSGDIKEVQRQMRSFNRAQDDVINHYVKYTGKTVEEIKKAISFDNEMTAEEAVAFGLADHIGVGSAL